MITCIYIYVYCHVLVIIHGVWIDNLVFWTLITPNYRIVTVSLIYTLYRPLELQLT
jgi:hypothetical protein